MALYDDRKITTGERAAMESALLRNIPLRGTPAWDRRERFRAELGCKCLSFGSIPEEVCVDDY